MRRWLPFFLITALLDSSCTLPPRSAQPVTTAPTANASAAVTLGLLGHVSGAAIDVAFQGGYTLLPLQVGALVFADTPAHIGVTADYTYINFANCR